MDDEAIRKEQGKRLKRARLQAGYRSARGAAIENNWAESSYRAHEAGTRTIGQDDAEVYATRFRGNGVKVSAQDILFGAPNPPPAPAAAVQSGLIKVPLLDWVSAGRLGEAKAVIAGDGIPLLAFAGLGRGDFVALRVKGDSMDRISPEDSIIVVNRSDRQLVTGRYYVFSRRGEATYKRWHANPDYLAPFSTNPANEPIFIQNKKDFEVVGRVRRTILDL